jgi:hypothetical protein
MRSAPASSRFARPLAAAVVAGLSCNVVVAVWALIARPALNSDFRGLWSFARFARQQAVARIYQPAPLQAYQHRLFPGFRSFFPYQYPPSFLAPIGWLSHFSYPVAQMLWTLAGLLTLTAASWIFFAPKIRRFAIAALLAAPATLLNGVAGETGYFTAALLLAGFALLPKRPVLAGIAFGLLTLKPQLGLLVPFALLGRRDYRAMLAAGVTALALIVLSCLVFPPGLWPDWLRQLPIYQGQYLAAGPAPNLDGAITVASNLIRVGIVPGIAWRLQAAVSLASAAAVFIVFRRAPYPLGVAAVLTAGLLGAPHAYVYDSIPLTAAMILLQPGAALLILCLAIYLAPYLLLTTASPWFLYAFPETGLYLGIIYLALTAVPPPDIAHEPISAAKSLGSRH